MDQARHTAYACGYQPGEWLDLTPGELNAVSQARNEQQEAQLLIAARHAQMIRAAVWAEDCPDLWELAGVEPPADELERRAQEGRMRYRLFKAEIAARGGAVEPVK